MPTPLLYVYDCYQQFFKRFPPPAITSGLSVFLVVIFFITTVAPSVASSLVLKSSALTSLELNRLSFYPLIHVNLLHLFFNIWALAPLLAVFESTNGTVRTGIVLNVLAVVTGVSYSILGMIFFPNASVAGASAWVFSFLGYYAYHDYRRVPVWHIANNFNLPTWATPLFALAITTILVPSSSFMGHVLGLGAGYAMALGYLDVLIEPSTKVVEWIESKLSQPISMIPAVFKYHREVSARDTRGAFRDSNLLPVSEHSDAYGGQGHTLA